MRLPRFVALLAAVTSTSHAALQGASPFFLLSTQKSQTLPSQQLTTASHLEDNLISALSKCDSNIYFFVSYPGLDTAALQHKDAMPKLQQRLQNSNDYKSVVQIPQVLGETDIARVAHSVSQNCRIEEYDLINADILDQKKKAIYGPTTFPSLNVDPRRTQEDLNGHDAFLDAHIKNLVANHTSHTIVLVGVPSSDEEILHWEQENEPPLENGMHTDLKRDVETRFKRRQQEKSNNPQDGLPLFEKYQFLSPGIFMGLTVFLLLFIILYVGITAIAGLEVSYMSFSKEMGPNAQKKQQ